MTTPFTKYQLVKECGVGAYGQVISAKNTETGEIVAIKKLHKVFDRTILAKRALREAKLLRFFNGHKNITGLIDLEIPNSTDFNQIYLVQEYMEADLHKIIRSDQQLTDSHIQYFIYQILRGLKYIHSANVLHRDLKPANILVNGNCELKICDFGLARRFTDGNDNDIGFMTEYVATRWYRAPEIMLSFHSYTKAIDLWSVGCIFAELIGRKALFKGRDYVDQLNQILRILGTPTEETLNKVGSSRAQAYIRSLESVPKIEFSQLYPQASASALDLLQKLLEFDPLNRFTVDQAIAHPYLMAFHNPSDEPIHQSSFNFDFEKARTIDEIKTQIVQEQISWRLEKQSRANRPLSLPNIMRNEIVQEVNSPESCTADHFVKSLPNDTELEKDLQGIKE